MNHDLKEYSNFACTVLVVLLIHRHLTNLFKIAMKNVVFRPRYKRIFYDVDQIIALSLIIYLPIPRRYKPIEGHDLPTTGWLVGMLLVSRSGLVEEDTIEVFHYYDFHLSSSFLM